MKNLQSPSRRPGAIHPVGFCGSLKARILIILARRAGKRATRAIDGQPSPQYGGMDPDKARRLHREVTATYEGLQYDFSISGESDRRPLPPPWDRRK